MNIEIKVPELPESISDALVLTFYKKVGDYVALEDVIVDLETDKVVLEVPSPEAGVITRLLVKEGDTVTSATVMAVIDTDTQAQPDKDELATATKASEPVAVTQATKAQEKLETYHAMGPAVRKLIEEHGLNPNDIVGTGKNDRIVKSDVVDYLAQQNQRKLDEIRQNSRFDSDTKKTPQVKAENADRRVAAGDREQRRVPMTRLRSRIAERLLNVSQTTAMLTTFNEVDLSAVMQLRKDYQAMFVKTFDVKLGFMSLFVKATCEALKRFPEVNASIDGTDIVYHGFCDIGVAVSTERGLVVPIIRSAEHMSLSEIEKNIISFAGKAKTNALTMDDITGGTFTITNGGVFGSMMSTPILNPPQSAILGMHAIMQRPVAVDGEVVIRPMMYLALSYDHQIIDGKSAVQFLKTIKDLLEDPARILLDV
jgi:2-oxoglutarate dehydrogenase E2 component (dihydrolipoamide succinyltransferase)